MQQVPCSALQVEALGGRVRGDQDTHIGSGIIESSLDVFAIGFVHALWATGTEQRKDSVLRVAFAQAAR